MEELNNCLIALKIHLNEEWCSFCDSLYFIAYIFCYMDFKRNKQNLQATKRKRSMTTYYFKFPKSSSPNHAILVQKHFSVRQTPQNGMWEIANIQMVKMLEIPAKHIDSQNAWKLAWNPILHSTEYETKTRRVLGIKYQHMRIHIGYLFP